MGIKSGRPTIDPAGRGERVAVYLTPSEAHYARQLGAGCPRRGLKVLIAQSSGRDRIGREIAPAPVTELGANLAKL